MSSENPTPLVIDRIEIINENLGLPLTYVIPNSVPIIDGKIKFYLKEIGVNFVINVRQTKGDGSRYADTMKTPNKEHLEILTALNKKTYHLSDSIQQTFQFSLAQIQYWVNEGRNSFGKKPIKAGSIQPRVSELKRRGIIVSLGDGNFKYDRFRAINTLETKQWK